MDYNKIYENLIERAKSRSLIDYSEKHHIVPRCFGGSDDSNNLVRLTPEEHYLAHQLLVKIHPDSHALVKAATMMVPKRPSNKLYGWLRKKLAHSMRLSQSGEGNSQFRTKWITNGIIERKVPLDFELEKDWFEGRLGKFLRLQQKKERLRAKKDEKLQQLKVLHEIYIEQGFEGVRRFGYDKSKANLVMRFAKHVPEFIPQNGKKRGA